MKKMMIFLLIAVLLLTAGCSAQSEPTEAVVPETTIPATEAPTEPPTEAPTEAPTEPVPECVNALVQTDNTPAILVLLSRGDMVDVVAEYDEDHWIVKVEQGYGLVEKQLLRFSGDESYAGWTGYARKDASIYANYQLTGDPLQNLALNTQVDVLDELEYCYVVQIEEATGYILKDELSPTKIRSGGSKSSGGADGGDISLGFGGIVTLSVIEQNGDVTGQAQILADGAQVVLGYFQTDEVLPVVAEEGFAPAWEGYHTVYLDGFYAYVPCNMVRLESEEPYIQWEGYSAYNSYVYDNYLLLGEGTRLSTNTKVTVLWDGGEYLVVRVDDQIGYMSTETVGTSRFSTGGGSSGGDWTPPVL